ncbi:uncharacterized protein LOC142628906 [Castanea sativa]|uniref:uncharacterized protein LOC142628906 n=1 Tax=Castanea sativa TaxID=21020 RepID=UPI003F64F22B
MSHPLFGKLLSDNWMEHHELDGNLQNFIEAVKIWNKEVFGNIFQRKSRIEARLNGIQKALANGPSSFLINLEKQLREEFGEVSKQEEELWSIKSREEEIVVLLREGYFALFETGHGMAPRVPWNIPSWSYRLSKEEMAVLAGEVTRKEVEVSLWSMKPFKAPSPDGYHVGFYQRNWHIVKDSIVKLVAKIFENGTMPNHLNKTLITLIPKCPGANCLGLFRPIGFCNTIDKLVSKVLLHRLRPMLNNLVSPLQTAFVPGRKGMDNMIIVQELIHSMKLKKGKQGYMAIKVDLEKAYDRMEWHFIRDMLRQKVNLSKSKVLFSTNVNSDTRETLSNILGISFTHNFGKYLGFPIKLGNSSSHDFDYILDKVQAKLQGWKANLLSMARRLTLTKAVLSAIPSYVIQGCFLSKGCFLSERFSLIWIGLIGNFLWSSTEEKRKMHLVGWNKVTKPKTRGGLGLHAAKERNLTLAVKLCWRMKNEGEKPWVKVLKHKYCRKMVSSKAPKSRMWVAINKGAPLCEKGLKWIIGSNNQLFFWTDKWLDFGAIRSCVEGPLNKGEEGLRVIDVQNDGIWDLHNISFELPSLLVQSI